jgi:hypothetical protein
VVISDYGKTGGGTGLREPDSEDCAECHGENCTGDLKFEPERFSFFLEGPFEILLVAPVVPAGDPLSSFGELFAGHHRGFVNYTLILTY